MLTFSGGLIGIGIAVLLTWVIPPMPLYSQLYKTANHEGDIFLHASFVVIAVSFTILSLGGCDFWILSCAESFATGSGGSAALRVRSITPTAGRANYLRALTPLLRQVTFEFSRQNSASNKEEHWRTVRSSL